MTIDKLKELGYLVSSTKWGYIARKMYDNLICQCVDISNNGLIKPYVSIYLNEIQTQQNIDDIQIAFNRLKKDIQNLKQ